MRFPANPGANAPGAPLNTGLLVCALSAQAGAQPAICQGAHGILPRLRTARWRYSLHTDVKDAVAPPLRSLWTNVHAEGLAQGLNLSKESELAWPGCNVCNAATQPKYDLRARAGSCLFERATFRLDSALKSRVEMNGNSESPHRS